MGYDSSINVTGVRIWMTNDTGAIGSIKVDFETALQTGGSAAFAAAAGTSTNTQSYTDSADRQLLTYVVDTTLSTSLLLNRIVISRVTGGNPLYFHKIAIDMDITAIEGIIGVV